LALSAILQYGCRYALLKLNIKFELPITATLNMPAGALFKHNLKFELALFATLNMVTRALV
jgi:hypothetical protein